MDPFNRPFLQLACKHHVTSHDAEAPAAEQALDSLEASKGAHTSLAAFTALSTSSACASATDMSTSPVRGSYVSKVLPPDASSNLPLMSSCDRPQLLSTSLDRWPRQTMKQGLQSLGWGEGRCETHQQASLCP